MLRYLDALHQVRDEPGRRARGGQRRRQEKKKAGKQNQCVCPSSRVPPGSLAAKNAQAQAFLPPLKGAVLLNRQCLPPRENGAVWRTQGTGKQGSEKQNQATTTYPCEIRDTMSESRGPGPKSIARTYSNLVAEALARDDGLRGGMASEQRGWGGSLAGAVTHNLVSHTLVGVEVEREARVVLLDHKARNALDGCKPRAEVSDPRTRLRECGWGTKNALLVRTRPL